MEPYKTNIQILPIEIKQIAVGEKKAIGSHGKVISIGSEVKDIKVGDMIVYRKWGLIDVIVDETVYFFIPDRDEFIVSKIKNE